MKTGSHIALAGIALNFAEGEASAPEWVQLTPAGQTWTGVDGRTWTGANAAALVGLFKAENQPLPIDFEHASEVKAKQGEAAPAIGWIEDVEAREGAVWARVAWNAAGSEAVTSRAYRYLSPVFWFDKSKRPVRLRSAGLTNQPNFYMAALNRAADPEEDDVSMEAICKALGLATDADEAAILGAINQRDADHQTALNAAQTPDLGKFVPRADYDAALNRATTAEASLVAKSEADRDAEISAAVDAAVAERKIAPASKEYHIAACKADGGFDRFKTFVSGAPVITAASGLDDKTPGKPAGALDEHDLAACHALGMDEDEYRTATGATKKEA